MRLDWATLANAAEARDGLLYLQGAGWDAAIRSSYPAPFLGALAMRLIFHPRELGRPHELMVELVTADGQDVIPPIRHRVEVRLSAEHPTHEEVPYPIAVNVSALSIESPGTYALEVFLDDTHLKTLTFSFQPPATGGAPPA